MKPLILTLMLTLPALLPAIECNPCTASIAKATKLPNGWLRDSWGRNTDQYALLPRKDGNGQDIRIQTEPDATMFFYAVGLAAEKDDKYQFTVELKGEGKFSLGYLAYADGGKWLFTDVQSFEAKKDPRKYTVTLTIKNGKDFLTQKIRPMIGVSGNSSITISDVSLRIPEE